MKATLYTQRKVLVASLTLCVALAGALNAQDNSPKPATEATKQSNTEWLQRLDFANKQDFEDAKAGFIEGLPDGGVVKNEKGDVVWDPTKFDFIDPAKPCPDTVNPSLWRISQLLSMGGIFKIAPKIYQVRGYDLSVITFIEGSTGVIVVDPLVSAETAAASLKLYRKVAGNKPVTAVIHTHSHVDHFGGVRGVTNEADVKAGKCLIVAPEHFIEEAVSENVLAGNVMSRRASYMYGNVVPRGPQGTLGAGLGTTTSSGTVTLIEPTNIIRKTGDKLTVDGLNFEFLMAPASEAPAEFHFFIPEYKALCTAENATHTLHNFYTLRGAKTRDSKKWVKYLNETLEMWGDKSEVLFAPHHWSITGNQRIVDHIRKYRDTFKYIHDQSLRMANQGYTMVEIGERIQLPPTLDRNWASRGYYGTVNHDAKAVYNLYLGFFNGNPSTLNEYPPAEASKRYVEFMGGADAVLAKAKETFARGDYRWTAQVVNHVVLADPSNRKARSFLADTLEQLGYQAEGGVWRNFYLAGAKELRDGVQKAATPATSSPDVVKNMPMELFLDYLAIQINPKKAEGKTAAIKLALPDTKESYLLSLENSVLNAVPGKDGQKADVTLTLPRAALNSIILAEAKLPALVADGTAKIEGSQESLMALLSSLEPFEFWFDIITANPEKP
ncbi:MAG: alkyl sulfatase dimerization domain-containing protein [Verrucomicrobiota bacterium]